MGAVVALEALCRRFRGFGLEHPVPEQTAALETLAEIGGSEAAASYVQKLVTADGKKAAYRGGVRASTSPAKE